MRHLSKLVQVVALLLMLPSIDARADVEVCQIRRLEAGSISPRLRRVTFPDGRKITVVGHNHGNRTLPDRISRLIMKSVDELSNEDFLRELHLLKDEASQAIEDAQEDLAFLNTLLRMDHGIQFIGTESTDPIVKNNIAGYGKMYERLGVALERRGIQLDSSLNDLVIAIISPSYYLQIRYPERLRGIEIAGFESEQATRAFSRALDEVDATRARLNELVREDKSFLREVGATSLQLDVLYPNYNPEVDHEKILKNIEIEKIPELYRNATMIWLEARLNEFDARKARDRAVVEGMVSRGESGVLFIGSSHRESIELMLKKACLAFK